MKFLRINGGYGEGGGQIIRTAITLSCITKKPIIIENIRGGRKSPGLKAQHITIIKILQKFCNADVKGATINSSEICFIPKSAQNYKLEIDVGTAGSVCLILQSLIPAMVLLKEKSELKITGGTDVLWSPTFNYMSNVVKEAFSRMGIEFSLKLHKRGYYPKGGGRITLSTKPQKINPIKLIEKSTNHIKIRCSYSKICRETINKEIKKIEEYLMKKQYSVDSQIKMEHVLDSGATVLACMIDGAIQGTDGLFDKRKKNFNINLDKIIKNNFGVDENLSDMLVLPASLASGMSIFRVPKLTKHLETNLFVASKISGCKYGIGRINDGFEVRIEGISNPSI